MIVMLDEGFDLAFEIARQEVVLQQDAVLERLMPALDLALGLRMKRSAADRRYALSPQQLFAWRRAARVPLAEAPASQSLFVPAVITAPPPEPTSPTRPARSRKRKTRDAGVIELEIDGIAMRVGRGADAKTVASVIRALKATS